jgi:hypothetical protein
MKDTYMLRRAFFALVLTSPVSLPVHAAQPVSASGAGPVAIGGHDSVSYHLPAVRRDHAVLPGDARFTVSHLGALWRFATPESAARFAANPARYVPQYNGFCANALSLDEGLIRTGGAVWEFFDEHLYLFYAERGRQRWLGGDWMRFRKQADAAWLALS